VVLVVPVVLVVLVALAPLLRLADGSADMH
jgi:hypothetical protein